MEWYHVCDLDWPLNASRGLSAIAEFLSYLLFIYRKIVISLLKIKSTDFFEPSRLRNDLYCVEWDVKLYYTYTIPWVQSSFNHNRPRVYIV